MFRLGVRKVRSATNQPSTRICFIETSDIAVESHLTAQLRHLKDSTSLEPVVISSDAGRLRDIGQRLSIRTIPVPMVREPSLLSDLGCLARLIAVLLREKPSITVYGTPKAGLLGAVAAFVTRMPNRIYVIHGLRLETIDGPGRWIMAFAEKVTCRLSHDVIAVSHSLAAAMDNHHLNLGRTRVLGPGSTNGVDLSRFERRTSSSYQTARRSLCIDSEDFTIGYIGRLHRDKGIDVLLKAFESMYYNAPTARLLLIGADDGSLIGRWIAQLPDEVKSRVEVLGEQSDVASLLPAFDCIALPTKREGLPTVLLEASAVGVPMIATRSTGVIDVVEDDRFGWLVPIGDHKAMADALLNCYQSPEDRTNRAARAYEHVVRNYTCDAVADRWARYYCDISGRSMRDA